MLVLLEEYSELISWTGCGSISWLKGIGCMTISQYLKRYILFSHGYALYDSTFRMKELAIFFNPTLGIELDRVLNSKLVLSGHQSVDQS